MNRSRGTGGWSGLAPWALGLLVASGLGGCRANEIEADSTVGVVVPEAWVGARTLEDVELNRWWESFGSPELTAAVERSLGGGLDLRSAWARLRQARASLRAAGAPRFPALEGTARGSSQTIETSGGSGGMGQDFFNGPTESYSAGVTASYEVDLFGRIASAARAAEFEMLATQDDVAATALALAASAVEAWLDAAVARDQIELVEEQVRVSEELLEVTEQRFGFGSGNALAVLQQRRQLAGTRAELPPLRSALERAEYRLAVLAGLPPGSPEVADARLGGLPGLPEMPRVGAPSQLLERRPDLRAALLRVSSADVNVAQAIAERYPRLSLSAGFQFNAFTFGELLDRTIWNIAGNLVGPLIDGGARRAEVARREAVLEAAVLNLNATLLTALREVEDALSLETSANERLSVLEEQTELARAELAQAQQRYVSGVDTYLQVLSAVQVLQQLERQVLQERGERLQNRVLLHRALGGEWMAKLAEPAPFGEAAPPLEDSEEFLDSTPPPAASAGFGDGAQSAS